MSNLKTQKRIAAEVLGIGASRVWLNPAAKAEISQAMTREDVRGLIEQGLIREKPAIKISRSAGKKRDARRKKRRGVGHGKRSGKSNARSGEKGGWMKRVRSQRRYLSGLKIRKKLDKATYHKYYMQTKSGKFANLKQLQEAIATESATKKHGK